MSRSRVRRAAGRIIRKATLRKSGPVILMYHRIAEEIYDPWGLAVCRENFASQLDWLAAHRNVIPLARMIELHRQGALPEQACAISFDDGYECNAIHAAPMLQERGLCATYFLASRLLDPGREFWWDDLERIVMASETDRLYLDDAGVSLEWSIGSPDPADRRRAPGAPAATARQRTIDAIWTLLLPRSPEAIRAHIDHLCDQAGVSADARPDHRPMSRSQAEALPADTIAIGGHTLHHISMPDRPVAERKYEFEQGMAECTALRGEPVACFAYPYGHFDDCIVAMTRGSGLVGACTTVRGPIKRTTDPFALPRLAVGNWTSGELRANLGEL